MSMLWLFIGRYSVLGISEIRAIDQVVDTQNGGMVPKARFLEKSMDNLNVQDEKKDDTEFATDDQTVEWVNQRIAKIHIPDI
eukprot:scaffold42485_cov50-Attheya_sp.AAC.4